MDPCEETVHGVIQILPHGIEATKYQPAVAPLDSVLSKSFVFLFNGGLLPRKGIDILLMVSCCPETAHSRLPFCIDGMH